jgi:uncharacterized protein YgiB involved in biofilm formation
LRRPRKSSACVTLVLVGAAALAGCGGDTTPSRRAAYANKEECLADWGDPKECEEKPRSSSGTRSWGPSTGTWHSYSSGRSTSRSSGSRSSGSSSSISRGGFGSHGSSAS